MTLVPRPRNPTAATEAPDGCSKPKGHAAQQCGHRVEVPQGRRAPALCECCAAAVLLLEEVLKDESLREHGAADWDRLQSWRPDIWKELVEAGLLKRMKRQRTRGKRRGGRHG